MFEKSKTLKSAVDRVTTGAGNGEGDPIGVVEIYQELKDRPDLMAEAVKLIKARIKSRNPTTSCIAMDLLNQCMESIGFALQLQVTKKVLPRILKLALSHTQHPDVQRKAAAYIKTWASTYSADARLCAYGNAAKELSRVEEISGRTFPSTFCPVVVSLGDVRSMLRARVSALLRLKHAAVPHTHIHRLILIHVHAAARRAHRRFRCRQPHLGLRLQQRGRRRRPRVGRPRPPCRPRRGVGRRHRAPCHGRPGVDPGRPRRRRPGVGGGRRRGRSRVGPRRWRARPRVGRGRP